MSSFRTSFVVVAVVVLQLARNVIPLFIGAHDEDLPDED